jgi:phosphatidylserine/phosphatidylglycerophosphate/cardiolipin synthase-like enzyme
MPPDVAGRSGDGSFRVLITAEEAWPAFEDAVLDAREEILAGFRIFDMKSPLVGVRARAIGQTWFDLLEHAIRKGVRVEIIVSDFDPVVATELHKIAWTTVRQGAAVAELAEARPGQVQVRAAMHTARAGLIPRLGFMLPILKKRSDALNRQRAVDLQRGAVKLRNDGLPQLHPVTHHQKLAVIDGQTLYVGGLDLNERRWDTTEHNRPAAQTWSDVQVILRGPAAQEARQHLREFEAVCAGTATPTPMQWVKRTLSRPRDLQFPYLSPQTVLSEIEAEHIESISRAEHVIHIESQYMRSTPIAKALVERATQNPGLHLILILPALPEEVAFAAQVSLDSRYGLARQRKAMRRISDGFGVRLITATPVQRRMAARDDIAVVAGSPVIHVHNKVLVVDDTYAMVGSANLNGRSLRWDTEVALRLTDPSHVADLREALFRHWWPMPLPEEARAPATMAGWWRDEIARNVVRLPENRSGLLVPLDLTRGADMAQPLPGVTEDIV